MARAADTTTAAEPKGRGRGTANVSGNRESVESFVLVFLAFLVLGFEAEGFVIPTGSMAPTLLGRHKEVTCPQCGLVFAVDGNREVEGPGARSGRVRVEGAVCVNCRFIARAGDLPNFQGDRIYVIKTPLSLPLAPALGTARLRRWDVAVFKLPEDPEIRYIKRTVGMPGEVLRVLRGDVWVKPLEGDAPFRRPLRPWAHQRAMQILVHDDAHRPAALAPDPRWARWSARGPGGWREAPGKPGSYRAEGGGGEGEGNWSELRYRHVVPDPAQWAAVVQGQPLPGPPRASLVTDFYAYNTELTNETVLDPRLAAKPWRQPNWVGDLTLDLTLDVARPAGLVRIELIKAGVPGRCEIDLARGTATLSHGGRALSAPVPVGLASAGRYHLTFANVDDRLTLAVDGRLPFGDGLPYDPGGAVAPTAADLEPAAVAARGADVAVGGLVLSRDIYYTLQPGRPDWDSVPLDDPLPNDPVGMTDWLADPRHFAAFAALGPRDFPIAPGRYMMFGDNSPWSRDGRDWRRVDQIDPESPGLGWDRSGRESWEVPEALVVGKAFCVYWPHLKPVWPGIRIGRDLRVPAVPNVGSMRWVR